MALALSDHMLCNMQKHRRYHSEEQDTQQPTGCIWRRTRAGLTTLSSSLRRKVTLSSATTRRSISKSDDIAMLFCTRSLPILWPCYCETDFTLFAPSYHLLVRESFLLLLIRKLYFSHFAGLLHHIHFHTKVKSAKRSD